MELYFHPSYIKCRFVVVSSYFLSILRSVIPSLLFTSPHECRAVMVLGGWFLLSDQTLCNSAYCLNTELFNMYFDKNISLKAALLVSNRNCINSHTESS